MSTGVRAEVSFKNILTKIYRMLHAVKLMIKRN